MLQASKYWPGIQVDGRVRLELAFQEFRVQRFHKGKKSCRVRLRFRLEHGVMSTGMHANGAVGSERRCATRRILEEFRVTSVDEDAEVLLLLKHT